MSYHFEVGEVAIIAQANQRPRLIGSHCTVVQPLRERIVRTRWGQFRLQCYVIALPSGEIIGAPSESLRKRHESGSWEAVRFITGFMPLGVGS